MDIRLAGIEPTSTVDGQGLRYTIFVQGCAWNCPGCHNPETHDPYGGYLKDIEEVMNDISDYSGIRGITLSGGDPLYRTNREAVAELCKRYKDKYPDKTIWLYTGYIWEEITTNLYFSDNAITRIIDNIDVMVDGKFKQDLKSYDLKFRGSSNQRIIDVNKSIGTGRLCEYTI